MEQMVYVLRTKGFPGMAPIESKRPVPLILVTCDSWT